MRHLGLACVAALCASAAARAQYVRTHAKGSDTVCVSWTHRDFTYHLDADGSARTPGDSEAAAVEASFATWQAISDSCSDFTFTRGDDGHTARTGKGTPKTNDVIWRERSCDGIVPVDDPCWADDVDTCSSDYDCWAYGAGVLALTTVTHSTRTGAIFDADIELDGSGQLFTTVGGPPCRPGEEAVTCVATDVQNTMTHEIGHVLGFDHVEDDPTSTMFPTAAPGEISKRMVDHGTVHGFCATYARGAPPLPCDPLAQTQRRIVARGDGTPEASQLGCAIAGPGPLALVLALAFLRRRVTR